MHKSRIVKLLKLAYKLDKSGNFRESDKITYKLTRIAQYYGNFMTTDTVNRVVPFEDTEEDVEIDAKRLDKQDRFRVPESKDDEASNISNIRYLNPKTLQLWFHLLQSIA